MSGRCQNCGEEVRRDDNGAGGTVWVHLFGSTVCYDDPPGSMEDHGRMTVAEPEPLLATIENMREHYAPGVFAQGPFTGDECSANPADYFRLPEGEPLTDSEGEPMVLVTRRTTHVPVGA